MTSVSLSAPPARIPASRNFADLGIDPDELSNPGQATVSSAVVFTLGAVIRLIAIHDTADMSTDIHVAAVPAAVMESGRRIA